MSTETTEDAVKELASSERGDPQRTHPAEHIFRCWHHLVSSAADPRATLLFKYWSRLVQVFAAGDFVFCEPADRSWWVLLRVLDVGAEGIVVQHVVSKEAMGYQTPPPKPRALGENEEDFEFRRSDEFASKWAVVRKHDSHVMTSGQPFTREQCAGWLRQYLVTVRK